MKKAATFLLVLVLVVALSGVGILAACGGEAKTPTVTGVSPTSGKQGDSLDVTITGTYLGDATTVSFGSGITVTSFTAVTDTQITASITIAASAAQGARTVSVTTPDGAATKSSGFTVSSPSAPSVTAISPESGQQAESLDVVITGANFINVSDVSLGEGVTVDSYNVDSATQISASVTVAADALEGPRDVSVTNPSGPGTGGGIFAVTWPDALNALIAAAEDEGTLNILSSEAMRTEVGDAMQGAMNAKYGINIQINMLPGPSMPQVASNLIQEYQAGAKASTDMYWGTETHLPGVYDAGIMQSFDWKEFFPYIPDECIQLDGTAVEEISKFYGITYNTNSIPADQVPKNVEDVLGRGWDLASTPYAASFDRMAMLPNWGYEKTKAFLEEFSAELKGLIRCGEEDRVASGEFDAFLISCGDRDVSRLQSEGAPVAHALFEDVPIMLHSYGGVPKHSEHPNLAALFMGFMLSKEGQQIMADVGYVSHHLIEGTPVYEEYNDYIAQGIDIVNFTADYVYDYLDQLSVWRAEFQAILAGA